MILLTKWFGCFLLDDEGKVMEKRLFPEELIPDCLSRVMKGEILDEERKLVAGFLRIQGSDPLGTGEVKRSADHGATIDDKTKISVAEDRLAGLEGCEIVDIKALETGDGSPLLEVVDRTLDPVNFGYEPDRLGSLLDAAMAEKERDIAALTGKDALISAAFNTLEDVKRCRNLMNERLEEWHHVFSTRPTGRKNIARLRDTLIRVTAGTAGSAVSEDAGGTDRHDGSEDASGELDREFGWIRARELDMNLVSTLAFNIKGLDLCRTALEKYIESELGTIAPNISAMAGAQVGAALITSAGSLKRLAMLPAGTVQLLGAEKAFFRFLKDGDKPPKHGYIYRIPTIRKAPREVRGRLSRHYATKISIGARMDYFSPWKGLNEDFLEKFEKKKKRILARER